MLKKFYLVVFIYFVFELLAISKFVHEYGFFDYLLEVLLSAVFGFVLMFRNEFLKFNHPEMFFDFRKVFGELAYSFGGFLLFLPGIICDFLGLFIIIISFLFGNSSSKRNTDFKDSKDKENDIIDVEIIEEK